MDNDYYAAHESEWRYIGIDADPPSGKIHVLTTGGISITGNRNTVGMIAWAPLMKRDRDKEALLAQYAGDPEGLREAAATLRLKRLAADHMARLAVFKDEPLLDNGRLMSWRTELVQEALDVGALAKTNSCCGVEDKYCSTDTYRGDLNAFSRIIVRLYLTWRLSNRSLLQQEASNEQEDS